jgi:hypothetical protein
MTIHFMSQSHRMDTFEQYLLMWHLSIKEVEISTLAHSLAHAMITTHTQVESKLATFKQSKIQRVHREVSSLQSKSMIIITIILIKQKDNRHKMRLIKIKS